MSFLTTMHHKEHIIDVMRYCVRSNLNVDLIPDNVQYQQHIDCLTQHMVLQLNYHFASKTHQTTEQGEPIVDSETITNYDTNFFEVPATWWDHLKETIGWKWLKVNRVKREFVVTNYVTHRKTTINSVIHKTTKMCPHTKVDPDKAHFTFLIYDGITQEY